MEEDVFTWNGAACPHFFDNGIVADANDNDYLRNEAVGRLTLGYEDDEDGGGVATL